jgi:hypothetical protein
MSSVFDTAYIYKISGGGLTYYGSTKNPKSRKNAHKTAFNQFMKGDYSKYITSAEVYKTGCADFEIIETLTNISKIDLQKKEREYITNNDCVNKNIPVMCDDYKRIYNENYNKENRQSISEQKKQYYVKNYDEIKKRRNEKITCDICGSSFKRANKSDHTKSKKHNKSLELKKSVSVVITNSSNNVISL